MDWIVIEKRWTYMYKKTRSGNKTVPEVTLSEHTIHVVSVFGLK